MRQGLIRLLNASLALLLLIAVVSCAGKKQPRPAIGVYRLTRCAQNGDHWVCECTHWSKAVNAKTGELIQRCD